MLNWFKKNFKFRITCTRENNKIQCITDGNFFNKIVFNKKLLFKLPDFIIKRLHFKPTKPPTVVQ